MPPPDAATDHKTRRQRPHIELAPDQPLTTLGRPRARVYVACLQCRTRKIRCDGTKPACHNCTRRTKSSDPCAYDAAPKRRGPDRTPGARRRLTREVDQQSGADMVASRHRRRSRRKTPPQHPRMSVDHQPFAGAPLFHSAPPASPQPLRSGPSMPVLPDPTLHSMASCQETIFYPDLHPPINLTTATRSSISPYDDDDDDTCGNITSEPSLEYTRQTWWDSLLTMYPAFFLSPPTLLSKRQQAANQITSDLRFLFRYSNYWLSFVNVPRFLFIYLDSEKRFRMQPSLLFAALAVSTFFQSSEVGFGKQGRQKAMRLRDLAQGALEASLNTRWIDEELAQAAWLLALFEICAHPDHSSERCSSAMVMLDAIIRTLSLTSVDVGDPTSAKFLPRSVPSVVSTPHSRAITFLSRDGADSTHIPHAGQHCSCTSRSLAQSSTTAHVYTPLWLSSPAWDHSWSEAEIRKEICRRLCWSTLLLSAGHTSYLTSVNKSLSELFILEPANIALLFPGESLLSDDHSGKDTIWSLNYRTILLWYSCLRIQRDPSVSEADMARFGLDAWLEADTLEKALDSHGCGLERTFLFQGREYLFNVRLLLTHEFQRCMPLAAGWAFLRSTGWVRDSTVSDVNSLFRKKAQEWLTHQANVAQRAVQSLGAVTGHASHTMVHRPFFVFWFMSQINRALSLWEYDSSLTLALDVSSALFKPIDHLSALWPCPEQRVRSQGVRARLAAACREAGRPLPPSSPPETDRVDSACM